MGEGLIVREKVGAENTFDIDRPCADIGIYDFYSKGIEYQTIDGLPWLVTVFLAAFGLFGEEVVAKVVVGRELLVDTGGKILWCFT